MYTICGSVSIGAHTFPHPLQGMKRRRRIAMRMVAAHSPHIQK